MRFYRNCSELYIYHFHKIMETSDYSYLVREWDEESPIEFSESERLEAAKIWGGIYNEYCGLTENNKALRYYSLSKRLLYLETRREVCGRLLTQMVMRKMERKTFKAYADQLREWELPYQGDKFDIAQLEEMDRHLRASENEIGLKRDELEKMKSSGEAMPLEKQVVQVEQALGRNLIDTRKTTVVKWVYLMDEVKSVTEARIKAAKRTK